MPEFSIYSRLDQTCLYRGTFQNIKTCLEHAVLDGAYLNYADLRHTDLRNANLDDATLSHADLSHADLTGANLSESNLSGIRIKGATLYGTCFAYANLSRAQFDHAIFGGTDVTGADLSFSTFAGKSYATLNYRSAKTNDGCRVRDKNGNYFRMSRPPISVVGLRPSPLIFLDDHVLDKGLAAPIAEQAANFLIQSAGIASRIT